MKNKKKERSFFGTVVYFFKRFILWLRDMRLIQRFKNRQKRLAGYSDIVPTENSRKAYFFGMAKVSFTIMFVVTVLLILLFGGRIFSYDNVYYMFKDIGYISSFSEGRPEVLNYSKPVNNQYFSSFKNGLAVVSDSEFKLFTSTGRATMTEGSDYVNPKIVTSSSNAIIYDGGRREYSVYNSFVRLYSETLEYPISQVDMADDGSYIVVTKSNKYPSVVKIYDSDFELVSEYSKNDHIISAEISDNGKFIAVASLDAREGESIVTLNILKKGSEKLYSTVSVNGTMPYKCSFLSNDRIALICSDRICIYDLRGNVKGEYRYPSKLFDFYVADGVILTIIDYNGTGKGNTVVLFDKNGKDIFAKSIDGNIRDAVYSNDCIYLLRDTDVVRIDTVFGIASYLDYTVEIGFLQVISSDEVILCTETTAYYLTFE